MLEILSFLFFVEVGYMPQSQVLTYIAPYCEEAVNTGQQFYTELGATVFAWDILYVGGSVRTHVWPVGGGSFWPHKADYLFRLGVKLGIVEIGFRHTCKHAVTPFQRENLVTVDEVHEEIFIRFEGKVGGKGRG